jgi:hypothetical protein
VSHGLLARRVEDTFNLLGHAVREVLRTVSDRTGRSIEDVAHSAGIPLVVGSSLKASLDRDWDDPAQRKQALAALLAQIDSLGKWLRAKCELTLTQPPQAEQWQTVERLIAQETEPDPEDGAQGGRRIKRGVAAERQISITDPAMRHGRKSKSTRVDGYKRHLGTDLDTKLTVAVCQGCALRMQCTRGKGGRSVTIHEDESFLIELRALQKTPEGRAELRRRTAVVHRLAHLVQHQGHQARYRGERKNLFDLRRHAIVENLFVAMADAA